MININVSCDDSRPRALQCGRSRLVVANTQLCVAGMSNASAPRGAYRFGVVFSGPLLVVLVHVLILIKLNLALLVDQRGG